jgi:hypothetical protein
VNVRHPSPDPRGHVVYYSRIQIGDFAVVRDAAPDDTVDAEEAAVDGPKVGDIVQYTLCDSDVRTMSRVFQRHDLNAGDVYPLHVSKTWGAYHNFVDGMVMLGGDDRLKDLHWVTGVRPGHDPGDYAWP